MAVAGKIHFKIWRSKMANNNKDETRGRPKKSPSEIRNNLSLRATTNDRVMLEDDFDGSPQAAFDFFIIRHRDKMKNKTYRDFVKAFNADQSEQD